MKQTWRVSYIKFPGKLFLVEHPDREVALYGTKYSKKAALLLIVRWLKIKAHKHLSVLLDKLSKKMKVKHSRLVIRAHKSQWGSFSASKVISLDYKIIFLPPVLVKHVLLHELCHAYHMSHSDKFWKKVEKFDKNWEKNDKDLDSADANFPKWAI
jgi:predicted metal-dependent hydrolase